MITRDDFNKINQLLTDQRKLEKLLVGLKSGSIRLRCVPTGYTGYTTGGTRVPNILNDKLQDVIQDALTDIALDLRDLGYTEE